MTMKSDPQTMILHTKRDDLSRYTPTDKFIFLELLQIIPAKIMSHNFQNVIITRDCEHELKRLGNAVHKAIHACLEARASVDVDKVRVETF